MMRRVVAVVVALSAACAARAEVQVPTGDPPLVPPSPPQHVVVPAAEQPTLPMPEPAPAVTPPASTPPRTAATPPRPAPTPVTPPVTVEQPPPPVILSTVVGADFEKRIRVQLDQAVADLARIDRRSLGADAKAQFDAAQGFVRQCQEALKVRNLVFAGQLADKAATMAALLRR
jgi:hypothetical protein